MADTAVPATLPPQSESNIEREPATTGDNNPGAKENVTMADAPPAASGGTLRRQLTEFRENILTASGAEPSSDAVPKESTKDAEAAADSAVNASATEGPNISLLF